MDREQHRQSAKGNAATAARAAASAPRIPTETQPLNPFIRPNEENKYREELDRKREKKSNTAKALSKTLRAKRPEPIPRSTRMSPALRQTTPEQSIGGLIVEIPVLAKLEPIGQVGAPAVPLVKATPTAIKNMRELLKNPESLATAFLLREVLDLPVSKRARRRL